MRYLLREKNSDWNEKYYFIINITGELWIENTRLLSMSTCEPMFWADFQVGQAWMSSMDGVWSAPKVVKVPPLNWQQTQPSEVPPPHKNQAWEHKKRWVTQPCQKVNPIKRRFFFSIFYEVYVIHSRMQVLLSVFNPLKCSANPFNRQEQYLQPLWPILWTDYVKPQQCISPYQKKKSLLSDSK